MDFKEEYATFSNRIKEAKTVQQVQRLEKSLMNLFDNGIFSPSQFQQLDYKLMDKGL